MFITLKLVQQYLIKTKVKPKIITNKHYIALNNAHQVIDDFASQ